MNVKNGIMMAFTKECICPKCNTDMDVIDWGFPNIKNDCCWQEALFQCPECKFEKKMHSVYEWKGYREAI